MNIHFMHFAKLYMGLVFITGTLLPSSVGAQALNQKLMDLIVECNQALNRGDLDEAVRIAPRLTEFAEITSAPYDKYSERCVGPVDQVRKAFLISATLAACDRLYAINPDEALLSPLCNGLYDDHYMPEFRAKK